MIGILIGVFVMAKGQDLGKCPYCDPNYMDVPNLESAMKGYDLPMGNPNRKPFIFVAAHFQSIFLGAGSEDPGVRNQIFWPMSKNVKGLMEVDGSFVSVNQMIKCDSLWTQEIHHHLKAYVQSMMKSSLLGKSLNIYWVILKVHF